jgi:site-specific DNA recombinase
MAEAATAPGPGADVLVAWAEQSRRRAAEPDQARTRFAFYGRVSTEDWQDPVTSRARQRDQAAALVAGHGTIVAEFFDAGQSRTLAWVRRPQAAALVAALADPDRGWDAIVIGEYERAFYGGQYASMAPLFAHYGVQLWMPEAGGPVGGGEDHEQLMLALGLQSKREITRTRIRVRTAMATQTREQGRYLGGPARPTGTASPTQARTRIRPTRLGAAARIGSSRTRRPRPSWCGCSASGWQGTAPRGSLAL